MEGIRHEDETKVQLNCEIGVMNWDFFCKNVSKNKNTICKSYYRCLGKWKYRACLVKGIWKRKDGLHFIKTVYLPCENRVFVNEWVGEGIYVKDFS